MELRVVIPPNSIVALPPIQTLEREKEKENPLWNALSSLSLNSVSSSQASQASQAQTPAASTVTNTYMECIACHDNSIVIGTTDGQLLSFSVSASLERDANNQSNVVINATQSAKRVAGTGRKPVDALIALCAENKLLVLADTSLMFHSLRSLAPISAQSPAFKGITAICADSSLDPPFNFCIAKKRVLQVYSVIDNSVTPSKELLLSNALVHLKKSRETILAADSQTYKLIHEISGKVTPLFPYDRTIMRPIICPVGSNEFLLAFATAQMVGLGMFVNSSGDAVRGTLEWPSLPKSIVFQFPNIFALLRNNTVHVHNLFNQEHVATIPIPQEYVEPRSLFVSSFPLRLRVETQKEIVASVFLACRDSVLMLTIKGIYEQILELIDGKQVSKGMQLAELAVQWGETDNTKKEVFDSLYERAGFTYFRDLAFEDAGKCFRKGEVSPVVVLDAFGKRLVDLSFEDGEGSRFHGWEVLKSEFEFALREQDSNLDEETVSARILELKAKARDAVTAYILYARSKEHALHCLEEMDNYLLAVYEESGAAELHTFLSVSNHVNVSWTEQFLKRKKRHFALILLYKSTGQLEKMLEITLKFLSQEYLDPEFIAEAIIADLVSALDAAQNDGLLRILIERLVIVDAMLAVQALIETRHADWSIESVLAFFQVLPQKDRTAPIRAYLEQLRQAGRDNAECSEVLLGIYFEDLKRVHTLEDARDTRNSYLRVPPPRLSFLDFLATRSDTLSRLRLEISRLIESSGFGTDRLAPFLKHDALSFEQAHVHAGNGQFQDALRGWVYACGDYGSAEQFCVDEVSDEGEPGLGKRCFEYLLGLYLRPDEEQSRMHEFSRQALLLLNKYPDQFNVSTVLESLPDRWSLNAVAPFLSRHVRDIVHESRTKRIAKGLTLGANLRAQFDVAHVLGSIEPVAVTVGSSCFVCGRQMHAGSAIARVPLGTSVEGSDGVGSHGVCHVACMEK
ncbi:transforming growth factor, beta receptor associated protein 1 [Chytriomyces hyalinus]|nr:transforming growth factor, beta receptor associated protein 1 [Chytriomyces hyalinus]